MPALHLIDIKNLADVTHKTVPQVIALILTLAMPEIMRGVTYELAVQGERLENEIDRLVGVQK